ncbi:MAG TPA: M13 family metallopeptidase [Terriglobales bacterium]|nr:M13 family metallopeptidase [Terriglobales bacterium]
MAKSCSSLLLAILLSCIAAFSQNSQTSQQPGSQTSASVAPPGGEPALAYSPSLNPESMDKSVDPCVDFYQYSCGGWQKNNPIPPDQTSWSVYGKLYEDNLTFLRGILEEAEHAQQRDAVAQKIGDFYGACMDEAAANRRGVQAIQPELDAIARMQSVRDLAPIVARLQLATQGSSMMFGSGSLQDPDNSEQQIAGIRQGGLGLPDRDYYTKQDDKSKETRDRYLQHVQKVLELLGDSPESAKTEATNVMRMETALAEASLTRVDLRDPYKRKNKMKIADLNTLAPNFDWSAFFANSHAPSFEILNVMPSAFFKELNSELANEPLDNWKNYLRFHIANSDSPYLSDAFVQENFDFYRKYLRGATELQPRWKRCVQYVDRDLGEALGQAYVRKVFSPQLKASTLDMVRRIEDAMATRIEHLDWMSPETKRQALVKLHGMRNKIGYPDRWRDYSSVTIVPDDLLANVRQATIFESHRELNKIGKPVDRAEWSMTPPTVNAYYDPQMNDINFPAGVLQPPLYDAKIDDAPNYGDTGGTIGHELTHGFDDEGRQFDAQGNLRDWWTKADAEKFKQRAACVEDQYAKYVVVDDVHINSKLTLGEDVADLGGEILAYMAWKGADKNKDLQPIDGLTPDQRFFVGFAQWACENDRPEDERLRAMTDPHSPARYRINGVVVNMPQFTKAFSCKAGQPMTKPADQVCRIW